MDIEKLHSKLKLLLNLLDINDDLISLEKNYIDTGIFVRIKDNGLQEEDGPEEDVLEEEEFIYNPKGIQNQHDNIKVARVQLSRLKETDNCLDESHPIEHETPFNVFSEPQIGTSEDNEQNIVKQELDDEPMLSGTEDSHNLADVRFNLNSVKGSEHDDKLKKLIKKKLNAEPGAYLCQKCHKQYRYEHNFVKHKCPAKMEKLCIPRFYKCVKCQMEFLTKKEYDNHRSELHGYKIPALKYEYCSKFYEFHKSILLKKGNFKCRSCNYRSELRADIFEHQKTCNKEPHLYSCPNCNYTHSNLGLFNKHKCIEKRKVNTKHPRFYVCKICRTSFPFKDEWDNHMQQIHGKESKLSKRYHSEGGASTKFVGSNRQYYDFSCTRCDFISSDKLEMFEHYKSHPEKKKRVKCQICYKILSISSIGLHMRSVHENIKVVCDICKKEFASATERDRHHRSVHLGFSYECPVCYVHYSQRNDVRRHIQRSHPNFQDWDNLKIKVSKKFPDSSE